MYGDATFDDHFLYDKDVLSVFDKDTFWENVEIFDTPWDILEYFVIVQNDEIELLSVFFTRFLCFSRKWVRL